MTAPPVNLEELERLLKAATPGPWLVNLPMYDTDNVAIWTRQPHIGTLAEVMDEDINGEYPAGINAALIVAAVNSLPALLTLARQAQAANTRIAALEEGLRPFADLGVSSGPDDETCSIPYRITRGSIRRARALLSEGNGG